MGPDCFTIVEECGRYWDGRLGGVLDPDQGRSWNYPSGSHRNPDLERVISYGTRVVPLNLVPRDEVSKVVLESGDAVQIAEIHPASRTLLGVLVTPISKLLVLNQRQGSDPLMEHVSFISFH